MPDFEKVGENLVRRTATGVIYLRAKVAGRVIRRSLKTTSVRAAKTRRDALLLELRRTVKVRGDREPLDLASACDLCAAWYAAKPSYQAKPRSLEYRRYLLGIIRDTAPPGRLSAWSPEAMRRWWTHPDVTRRAGVVRNNLLGTVRQMIALAIERGERTTDPTDGLARVKLGQKKVTVPSAEDFARIVADVRSQRKRASEASAKFIEFLAFSGCRVGEAQAVRWEDVREDAILVTGGAGGTKSGKERLVPIIPPMRALLDRMRYKGAKGPLFYIKSPRAALSASCERLGVPHVRIHDLRHLFATVCIESGVDIPTVSRWLGHQDGGALALRVYGHLRDKMTIIKQQINDAEGFVIYEID